MNSIERASRILCLHGYHGTGAVLRRQIAPVAASLPNAVELVFPDAPALRRGDFGWWHPGFVGWETSRDAGLSQLRAERFDGVFGFSQGAAMAGLMAAVQHADERVRLFDFAIMVSGFTSQLPEHARLFDSPIDLPTVHIIGSLDSIVLPHESAALARRFANPEILEHAGGHIIPRDAHIVDRITGFIYANQTPSADADLIR